MGRTRALRYRYLRRTAIAAPIAFAILLLVVLALWRLLESEAVQAIVARRIETFATQAIGVDLEIGSAGWTVFPPRLVLSDTRLVADNLRLEVDRLVVDLGGLWLANRTLTLDTVAISGLRVVARDLSPPSERRPARAPLRVVLRHLDVHGVELVGETLSGELAATCKGLDLSWVREGATTKGFVAVDALEVVAPGVEQIRASLGARFSWSDGSLEVPTWMIENDDTDLRGSLSWSSEGLRAHVDGDIDLAELDRVIRAHEILEGRMTVAAEIEIVGEPRVRAVVASKRLVVANLPLKDFRARLELSAAGLAGEVETARFFGGELRGTYRLGSLRYPFPHKVRGRCEGMDLASFLDTIGASSGGLSARADIDAEVDWESDHFPLGSGMATAVFEPGEGELPLSGSLGLELSAPGLLQFVGKDLHVGSSVLTIQGPLALKTWEPAWAIRADPGVLEEIFPAVNRWVGTVALPEEITGHGTVDVTLSGPWKRLRVGMRLDLLDLAFPPVVLDRAVVEAEVSDGECRIDQGRFSLGDGSGEVRGVLRWDPGRGREGLDLRTEGHQLSLVHIGSWLGLGEIEVAGDLSIAGGLSGTIGAPRGSWAVGVTDVEVAGQVVGDGSATVDLSDGVFSVRKLDFDRGLGGGLRWDVSAGVLNGDLQWSGLELEDHPEWMQRFFGTRFDWDLGFSWPYGGGSPEGAMVVEGDGGRLGVAFDESGLKMRASLDGMAEGELEIVSEPLGPHWRGEGQVRVLSAAAVVRSAMPGLDVPLAGRSTIHLKLAGEGLRIDKLEGSVGETELRLNDRPLQLLRDRGFAWDQLGFRLNGIEASMGAQEVFFRGEIGADGSLSGNMSGAIDGVLLGFLAPDWEPTGRIVGVVELLGTTDGPLFEGIARIEGGSFRLPRSRSVFSDVNGSIFLSSGAMTLEDVTFRFMRGAGRCRGAIVVREGQPQLRLGGSVEGLEYPLFPGLSPRMSGDWRLDGKVEDLQLSGELVVERGEVRGKDDLPTLLVEWFGDEVPPRQETLRLDLRIRADETLTARSPFLRVVGSADLHVTGTDAKPGLVGRIDFQEGGEFTLQGVRYELDRGQVTFSDPTRIEPMFSFQTRARILDYEVFLQLNGTQDRLVPSVSSDPPLSPPEIYSLMALGTVGEGAAGGVLGISLASSMLTKSLNQTLSGRDTWLLPVDQVRVDPYIEAHTGDPSARVTVVKQLSPSVTVTLQSNLTGETNEVISVRWYTGSGYFWEATRDADGGVGVDFKLRRRY